MNAIEGAVPSHQNTLRQIEKGISNAEKGIPYTNTSSSKSNGTRKGGKSSRRNFTRRRR